MPDINWSTLTGNSFISNNFCRFVFQSNLEQVVDSPTNKHSNVLDLILTDCAENKTDLKVHPIEYQCISSDHNLINFYCEHNTSNTVPKETFNYNKGDYIWVK